MARSNEGLQPEAPDAFLRAVESLRAARVRPEVHIEETPAPKRLAPHTYALTADVINDEAEDPVATGRLVLLYDPAGQEAWHGAFRLVTYVRVGLEAEMGADPLLLPVAWTWLIDALTARSAPFTAASGTITRVTSESFGGMSGEPATLELEIRASWTPLDPDLSTHVIAWSDILTTAAGLIPLPAGVVAIPHPRTRKSR